MNSSTPCMQDRVRRSRIWLWPLALGWMALNAARLLQLQPLFYAASAVTAISWLIHLALSVQIARYNLRARPQEPAIRVHIDAALAARWQMLAFLVGGVALAIAYALPWTEPNPLACQWPQACFALGGLCFIFALSHPLSWALTLRRLHPQLRQITVFFASACLASLHFAQLL